MGDYVYLCKEGNTILDPDIKKTILRVVGVLESGVLELEGEDGQQVKEHVKDCQPCHLPIIEPTPRRMEELHNHLDFYLTYVTEEVQCQRCGQPAQSQAIVHCLICQGMWHVSCLPLPWQDVSQSEWTCYSCNEGA